MRTNKTKTGVDIKETQGMREYYSSVLWVIAASNSRVQVFNKLRRSEPLRLIHELAHPKGRLGGHELVSDRPGRSFQSSTQSHLGHQTGPLRHALSSHQDPKEQASDDWSRQIAKMLEEGLEKRQYDQVILVAEPKLAGRLHAHLSQEIQKRVIATYEKDFGRWLSDSSLVDRLEALVSSSEFRKVSNE